MSPASPTTGIQPSLIAVPHLVAAGLLAEETAWTIRTLHGTPETPSSLHRADCWHETWTRTEEHVTYTAAQLRDGLADGTLSVDACANVNQRPDPHGSDCGLPPITVDAETGRVLAWLGDTAAAAAGASTKGDAFAVVEWCRQQALTTRLQCPSPRLNDLVDVRCRELLAAARTAAASPGFETRMAKTAYSATEMFTSIVRSWDRGDMLSGSEESLLVALLAAGLLPEPGAEEPDEAAPVDLAQVAETLVWVVSAVTGPSLERILRWTEEVAFLPVVGAAEEMVVGRVPVWAAANLPLAQTLFADPDQAVSAAEVVEAYRVAPTGYLPAVIEALRACDLPKATA